MLLAAGKRSGDLAAALLQAGELLKHALHVALNIAALAGERAHVQIFLNGHLQEHPASLRDQCKPLGDDLVAGNVVQGLAHEVDMAGLAPQQAGDGVQRCGLTGTVGADQSNDLALVDLKGDTLDGVDAAVIDVDVINLQNGAHAHASFCLPR